ncbi:MAG: helix-turn-helix domain-containing protein [Phycisphaerae bacterium]|nr:helix-turn-helix domain-containing protein [Phycisphaerae bacterium]
MTTKRDKTAAAIRDDVPYTAKLPDGRTLFVLVPAKWCEPDAGGGVLFTPEAARFIDRVQAMATRTPSVPTPGYIRALREALGLTQTELAERIGVDKMTVARWEWGKLRPRRKAAAALDHLRRAAGRRGVSIAA